MSAFTPGPWSVRLSKSGYPYQIVAPRESDKAAGRVGSAITRWGSISLPSSEEGQANARLIAAAPDLLAALQDALEFAEDQEDTEDGPDGRPQANDAMLLAQTLRAAIAKATEGAA